MTSPNPAGETARSRWQSRYQNSRVRDADFTTLSGLAVDPAYGTDDSEWPGEFPFTRGLYPTGYRGRTWTIRQFAGFGNARQTNERYRMILGRGGGGLSVAFDMPTLMGRDSDDPQSLGEVGESHRLTSGAPRRAAGWARPASSRPRTTGHRSRSPRRRTHR